LTIQSNFPFFSDLTNVRIGDHHVIKKLMGSRRR
jgi:hypothetical protein